MFLARPSWRYQPFWHEGREFVAQAESDASQGLYPDRIIFMNMFNDIELHKNGKEERCIDNAREVSSALLQHFQARILVLD